MTSSSGTGRSARRWLVSNVQGMDGLIRRLKAIGEPKPVLRALQVSVIHEAQALVPRKTGHLQESIVPGELTDTHATVVVNANYGIYVEKGTGLYGPKKQRIVPKSSRQRFAGPFLKGQKGQHRGGVLVWKGGGPSKVRLSGRSRTKGGTATAGLIFATSTRGAKAQPFFEKGAKKAITKSGLSDIIVAQWNSAA